MTKVQLRRFILLLEANWRQKIKTLNARLVSLLIKKRKLETMLDELKEEQLIEITEARFGKNSPDAREARKARDKLERELDRVNNILRSRLGTVI